MVAILTKTRRSAVLHNYSKTVKHSVPSLEHTLLTNSLFATYGIYGGIHLKAPAGKPPPDTSSGTRKRSFLDFVEPDILCKEVSKDTVGGCQIAFNGERRTDCGLPKGLHLNDDGSCAPINQLHECKVFCEQERRGLLGPETLAPGAFGEAKIPGTAIKITPLLLPALCGYWY